MTQGPQVADRELHADALGAEPAGVAHAADRLTARREATQYRRSDEPGGTRQQKHAWEPSSPRRSLKSSLKDRPPYGLCNCEPCIGTKDNSCVEVCPVHPHPPDA